MRFDSRLGHLPVPAADHPALMAELVDALDSKSSGL